MDSRHFLMSPLGSWAHRRRNISLAVEPVTSCTAQHVTDYLLNCLLLYYSPLSRTSKGSATLILCRFFLSKYTTSNFTRKPSDARFTRLAYEKGTTLFDQFQYVTIRSEYRFIKKIYFTETTFLYEVTRWHWGSRNSHTLDIPNWTL